MGKIKIKLNKTLLKQKYEEKYAEKNETWERNCQKRYLRNSKKKDIIPTIKPEDWENYFKGILIESKENFQDNPTPKNQNALMWSHQSELDCRKL